MKQHKNQEKQNKKLANIEEQDDKVGKKHSLIEKIKSKYMNESKMDLNSLKKSKFSSLVSNFLNR